MGLRLETYNNNFVGLIVDFAFVNNSSDFCNTDSIQEAIEYFDLYLDESTAHLKRNDPNEKIVNKLGIDSSSVDQFITMLDSIIDTLTDEQAGENKLLFPVWNSKASYKVGDRVRYLDILYKCLQAHTAQETWTPTDAPSLWARVLIDPEVEGPQEWIQPGSTNGYSQGDRVIHNGIIYESVVDNNVWEPGVVGTESLWEVVEDTDEGTV